MGSERLVKNFGELVGMRSGVLARLRRHALEAVEKALLQVMPENALRRAVRRRGARLRVKEAELDLKKFKKVLVLGVGKASIGMASYMERVLGPYLSGGFIVARRGEHEGHGLSKLEVAPSTHPIPSMLGVKAAKRMLEYAEAVDEETLVMFLLSGGASAMLPLPADPVTLQDKAETTRLLLASGATIDELNTVRKHLSMIKGGWLGKRLSKARVISLILSDVVGDKLETIGSGPTAPDPTTFRDAYEVLKRYGLWERVPESVRNRITMGLRGEVEETPKPGDPAFKRITNVIIAGVGDACAAARRHLAAQGYKAAVLTRFMEGEASEVGKLAAGILKQMVEEGGKRALIIGGETTVTVRGRGTGGRNQELALSAAIAIRGLPSSCLVSVGTDGVDGPTDAAGAIVDGETYGEALAKDVNPIKYLRDNDSNTFFKTVGGVVMTGPTGTNVGDILIMLSE